MRMCRIVAATALVLPGAAAAEVKPAGPAGFVSEHVVTVPGSPVRAYAALGRVQSWWSPAHTYSGVSANLRLALKAGGCFCERLPTGGGIEHMRVSFVVPGERLVLTGALGPLLYEAAAGVMDVKVERIAGGSRLVLNYRVAGFANGGADRLAPLVDQVLGDQMARFRKYAAAARRNN